LKPTNQLERLAADMVVLCADPSNLHSALDLLNASYGTPAAAAARSRLQADPAIAPLIAADLIHRVHDDLEPEGPTGVDVGRAIAYGLELGVRELVGPNPFAAEPSLRG